MKAATLRRIIRAEIDVALMRSTGGVRSSLELKRDVLNERDRAWSQIDEDSKDNRRRMLAMFSDDDLTPQQRREAVKQILEEEIL